MGCCSIKSAHQYKIKFERQIDLLDLVDRGRCARIIRWENYLINEKEKKIIKLHYRQTAPHDTCKIFFFSTCKHAVSFGSSKLLDTLMQNILDASSITHHSSP